MSYDREKKIVKKYDELSKKMLEKNVDSHTYDGKSTLKLSNLFEEFQKEASA